MAISALITFTGHIMYILCFVLIMICLDNDKNFKEAKLDGSENPEKPNKEGLVVEPKKRATLRQMYQYLTAPYYILLYCGLICSVACGILNIANLVLIREIFSEIQPEKENGDIARKLNYNQFLFGYAY